MNKFLIRGLAVATASMALSAGLTSCNDLDLQPKYETTPDRVYVDLNGYRSVLAKVYGGFAVTGLGSDDGGASGGGDVQGIDEGTSDYIRQLWSAQVLSTDEAILAWGDAGVRDWHNMNWTASNPLIRGLYYRIYYEIAVANEFIRESSDEKLNSRLSGGDIATAKRYRAEARFLRAVAYQHILDLYGGGPFVVETDPAGVFTPPYRNRQQLFDYVESEMLALSTDADFAEPRSNEYGRVDKAAAWGMLSRLYLNAQVYTGTPRYTDAATYAKRVIDAGYALSTAPAGNVASAYGRLFLADNHTTPARNEIIWPVTFDANNTRSFGGTTFLVNGSTSPSNTAWKARNGMPQGGWGGMRATKNLVNLFGADTARDTRGRFWTQGQTLEIADVGNFNEGLGVIKFRNVTSTGTPLGGSQSQSSVDFPMIRLGEMMLNYAEAVKRGGSGDANLALTYVNQLRARAYAGAPGSAITAAQLTTDYILDERGRELFWEGFRRTDLIRYGRFVEGSYLWPWKGGVQNGRGVDAYRVVYPLPASDLSVNKNLRQNDGY
ncbi:RagB/SusD family nutrient uptake outer membrane protein [Microvirga sp. STR05]|uniref:RagB/SusD family nutrient uptake outer membrane protein n=1 Tax=Hymenobacter duratus TaxID=2771356 RepID=A0ABR8JE22_9BACT|nr:RagB/SusD family nutrient uptake outer membrane protein [Hymenobacter duratus]MBD2715095.1 RagB/SusD family nutrient uptake outer membrane protein [Hymenobacter duratus]MBR7950001.1 RagB/SusD family nutrient uptake outer membrane protein [Microvirga sp. STR05]